MSNTQAHEAAIEKKWKAPKNKDATHILSYLISCEQAVVFVIGIVEFPLSLLASIDPVPHILCTSGTEGVASFPVSQVIAPFSFVSVTIDIGVFALPISQVIHPLT